MRSRISVIAQFVLLPLVLAAAPLLAQDAPGVRNLGGTLLLVDGDWLVIRRADLNGDGDLGIDGTVRDSLDEWLIIEALEFAQGEDLQAIESPIRVTVSCAGTRRVVRSHS